MRWSLVACACVALLACSKKEPPAPMPVTSAEPPPAPPPLWNPPVPSTSSRGVKQTRSYAQLKNGQPVNCVDVTANVLPAEGAGAAEGKKGRDLSETIASMTGEKLTTLTKRCAEEYPSRKPVAACEVTQADMLIVSSYYALGESADEAAKECRESGGAWTTAKP
jgi:hypothetical protein